MGYGFNSNRRYGQGSMMRERFIPRILQTRPDDLIDATGNGLDPHTVWAARFRSEKPGGHVTLPDHLPGIGFEGKADLFKHMQALSC